jgi:hypothetical protein
MIHAILQTVGAPAYIPGLNVGSYKSDTDVAESEIPFGAHYRPPDIILEIPRYPRDENTHQDAMPWYCVHSLEVVVSSQLIVFALRFEYVLDNNRWGQVILVDQLERFLSRLSAIVQSGEESVLVPFEEWQRGTWVFEDDLDSFASEGAFLAVQGWVVYTLGEVSVRHKR